MILPIKPLSQRDPRWNKQRLGTVNGTTLGSHGCVVTSMAMLSSYYNHPILPNQLDDILTDRSLYYDGNLFVNDSITKVFPDIKFDKVVWCETTPAPIAEIKKYLDAKKPVVVALINQGIRHYVLAVGYEGNQIIVNDPWQGDTINIKDRWGDSASKILQVNFFSSNPPAVTDTTPSTTTPTTNPQSEFNDQTRINLGGELGTLEVGTIRSIILDLKRDKSNLEGAIANFDDSPQSSLNDMTRVDLGGELGIMEIGAIRSQLLDLKRNNSNMERALANLQNEIEDLETQLEDLRADHAETSTPTTPQPPKPNSDFGERLKSRKFILSIAASLIAFLNSTFNLGLDTEQIITVITPLLAYIGVEGVADIMERGTSSFKNIQVEQTTKKIDNT